VIDLPNNHLQYAITWYGLALALVAVSLFAWLRRKS
jgi:surfeit locus 1 family protein